MSYDALRTFADSYVLGGLGVVYLICIGWAFRPGTRHHHEKAATMILDDAPEQGSHDHG